MTPTPEDIALAEKIVWAASSDADATEWASRKIAAHTAPLRERIKELEQQVEDLGYEIKEIEERSSE